jgi:hypothetical protein
MKRLSGTLIAAVGCAGLVWGGYSTLMGQSEAKLVVIDKFAITALVAGLSGAALFCIGLLWMRD